MKVRLKKSLLTNLALFFVLVFVFSISLIPQAILPIYSGIDNNPIYNGNKENKKISLMFNVYENANIVKKIVDELNKHNAKSTFFVGGCWADDNLETLLYILNNGHEIANHGYFHKDHSKLSYEENYNEILNNDKLIYGLCGVKMTLFAPPSGSFSNKTLDACYNLDYKTIMWTKDTIDWRDKDKKKIVERATKNDSNGDLILMHPKEHTLLALNEILEYYITKGYEICTVTDNIA